MARSHSRHTATVGRSLTALVLFMLVTADPATAESPQTLLNDLDFTFPTGTMNKIDGAVENGWRENDKYLENFLGNWLEDGKFALSADWDAYFAEPFAPTLNDLPVRIKFKSLKNLSRILLLEGRRHAFYGRAQEAWSYYEPLFRIARGIGKDPDLASFMSAVALRHQSYPAVRDLARSNVTDPTLKASITKTVSDAAAEGPAQVALATTGEKEIFVKAMQQIWSEAARQTGARDFTSKVSDRVTTLLTEYYDRVHDAMERGSAEELDKIYGEVERLHSKIKIRSEELQDLEKLKKRYEGSPKKFQRDIVEGIAILTLQISLSPKFKSAYVNTEACRKKYDALLKEMAQTT